MGTGCQQRWNFKVENLGEDKLNIDSMISIQA
jgi:hypothetical protein